MSTHGDDKNFWRMADTGPCGPCSEIHYDRGAHLSEGPECVPDHSEHCPRWLEIWNLVFMEFDQRAGGAGARCRSRAWTPAWASSGSPRSSRASPPTTTRTCSRPSIARMRELLGHDPDAFESERFSYQVIADHSRAITFLIADGVLPSNEGRGYVLRRIVPPRRAARPAAGSPRAVPGRRRREVVIETMGDAYPILRERREVILGTILREEAAFARTLDAGTVHLEEALIPLTGAERVVGRLRRRRLPDDAPVLPGEVAFRLHDTYGFPIDLTVELAGEYGVRVDRAGFEAALEEQRTALALGPQGGPGPPGRADRSCMTASPGRPATPASWATRRRPPRAGSRPSCATRTSYQELEARPEVELRVEAGAAAELVLDRTPVLRRARRPGG